MVFSFGALFSGFVIFYTRSGSLVTSWPFVISMLALMLGTEFRRQYFYRLSLQITVWYMAVLSWAIFFLPVILKNMGAKMFILSSITSLVIIILFFILLGRINRPRFHKHQKNILVSVIACLIVFNALYATNIIPPIPLSLKYKAVYYEVTKLNPGYQAQYERSDWFPLKKRSRHMYWREGEDLFVFAQVFAPIKLTTTIAHHWEYYDEDNRRWVEQSKIPITISGGRKEGYRGFSKKSHLDYGKWRVRVKSSDGKTLGSIAFSVNPYPERIGKLVSERL